MPPPKPRSSCGRATLAMVASKACIAVAIIRARVAWRRPNFDNRAASARISAAISCPGGARGRAEGKPRCARGRETVITGSLRFEAAIPAVWRWCHPRPSSPGSSHSAVRPALPRGRPPFFDLSTTRKRDDANIPGILSMSPRLDFRSPRFFVLAASLVLGRQKLAPEFGFRRVEFRSPAGHGTREGSVRRSSLDCWARWRQP